MHPRSADARCSYYARGTGLVFLNTYITRHKYAFTENNPKYVLHITSLRY